MAILMDKIVDEEYARKKKSLDQKKAETVKGSSDTVSDAEWNDHIKKKAIEDMRKAGAKLAAAGNK